MKSRVKKELKENEISNFPSPQIVCFSIEVTNILFHNTIKYFCQNNERTGSFHNLGFLSHTNLNVHLKELIF